MTDKPAKLRIPTVHLNGTSKNQLLEQLCSAIDAVHAAGRALANAAPNGRDYYTQSGDAIREATQQHEERMTKLRSVADDLEQIALAVSDQ